MRRWSHEEHRAISCEGKVRYESGAAAGKARDRIKKKSKNSGGNRADVSIYRCQYCGLWHLGRDQKAALRLLKLKKKGEIVTRPPRDTPDCKIPRPPRTSQAARR